MVEDKVSAIYRLREAAENHGKILEQTGDAPTSTERRQILDARLELEQRTREAVEACVYCGRPHADDEASCDAPRGQVIEGKFGGGDET